MLDARPPKRTANWAVTPWSYSSLSAFEECPRRYKLIRLTKQAKDHQTPALAEGNRVHKALEEYVGNHVPLPEQYRQYQPLAERVRAAPGQTRVEFSFGLTKALTPTTFFGKDVWVRGKLDVVKLQPDSAIVLDWKNGKPKDDPAQLRLFAGATMHLYPHISRVTTGYVWLTADRLDPAVFTRDDDPGIWQEFAIRVHRMEKAAAEDDFPARPSGLCKKWCPVGRALCEHCGE